MRNFNHRNNSCEIVMILVPLGLVVKLYEDKFGDAVVDRVSERQADTQRTRRETGGVSWSCQKVASKMSIRAREDVLFGTDAEQVP